MRKAILLSGGVILLIALIGGCAETTERITAYLENRAIDKAARHYLDAEVKRDYKDIYASLAPSSQYCANNTYEMYLAEAKTAPVIASYKIVKISGIRVNEDRQLYPKVEKFAQVEVELVLIFNDAGKTTEVNFAFPFIKEGGEWYKG
jgi:hypothetical protein